MAAVELSSLGQPDYQQLSIQGELQALYLGVEVNYRAVFILNERPQNRSRPPFVKVRIGLKTHELSFSACAILHSLSRDCTLFEGK